MLVKTTWKLSKRPCAAHSVCSDPTSAQTPITCPTVAPELLQLGLPASTLILGPFSLPLGATGTFESSFFKRWQNKKSPRLALARGLRGGSRFSRTSHFKKGTTRRTLMLLHLGASVHTTAAPNLEEPLDSSTGSGSSLMESVTSTLSFT